MEHIKNIKDFLNEALKDHTIISYSNDLFTFTGLFDDGSISNKFKIPKGEDFEDMDYYPSYTADDDKKIREISLERKKIYYREIFKIFKDSNKKFIHDFLESHLDHRIGVNYITATKFNKKSIIYNSKKINLPTEVFTGLADMNSHSTICIDKKIYDDDISLYDINDLKIDFNFKQPYDIVKFIISFLPPDISGKFFEISNPSYNITKDFDADLIKHFKK